MKQDTKTTVKVTTEVPGDQARIVSVKAEALWKLQVIRLLQLIGYGALAVGGAEWTGIIAVLPTHVAAWLVSIGPLLVASKPLVEFLGDWFDDGILNKSFKIPGALLMILACCLFFASCANFGITPDGCAMASYSKDGRTWSAGPCIGSDGQVERYRAEWTNDQGVRIRYERITASGRVSVRYQAPDQSWLVWDSKSGILLGPVPPGIEPVQVTPSK